MTRRNDRSDETPFWSKYSTKELYQAAMTQWLTDIAMFHLTLNFNMDTTMQGARGKLKRFLAMTDRYFLGNQWLKFPGERTLMVFFIEHPDTNIHYHGIGMLPGPCKRRRAKIRSEIDGLWRSVVPSGSTYLDKIDERADKVAEYDTKERRFGDFVISSEFWTYDLPRL